MWCREFVQDDVVQRDWYLLSLVRKGLSRKYLESGFSIIVWIREKEQSARRPHTEWAWSARNAERIWAEPAGDKHLGWESSSSQARAGYGTLSVWWEALGDFSEQWCDSWLDKTKTYAGPLDGNCILKASTEMVHWDMVQPTKQMMSWAEFCSARVKTDGGNVIYGLGWRMDHTSGWMGCSIWENQSLLLDPYLEK